MMATHGYENRMDFNGTQLFFYPTVIVNHVHYVNCSPFPCVYVCLQVLEETVFLAENQLPFNSREIISEDERQREHHVYVLYM